MLSATQSQLFKMDGSNISGFQPYKAYGGTYDEAGNQTAYDPSKAIAGFSPMQQQAMAMANGPEGFAQNVGGYMSPYMQNVTDIQKREAARQSGIQGMQQQAQATQAGAFGGSRDAIQRAERERNLSQQMGDIQAQGSQAAFANAQNQFNTNLGQMNAAGAMQQQNQQQGINQAMQDYANAQQYPLMQLGTMSNMLRGLPMQAQTTQQYQAQANPITQGIGAIGSLGSLAQVKAEGGAVKSMASGGITSIPRYDVGGAVVSQLATMPDEALKKEAMESPSPRVREMAAAILKQRQAGLNAEPQMEAAPAQGVGPMGVDYNANYAGGGIIAFADGKKVDAAEAARNAKQTEMYVLGAKLAAEQRRAQEADALLAAASAAPLSPGIKAAPTEEQATSVAGRLADTIGSGISSVTRGITDKWDALSAMREQNQKRAAAIPGFFESLTPTQRAERAAQEKAANEEYKKIYNNKFQPFGSKPIGDSSGFKAYVGPSGKASEISTLLQGGREPIGIDSVGTTTEKRAPVVAEKRTPVVVKEAGPAAVAKAPPALLDRNAPAYTGAAVEAAPTGIAAVDPLADSRATLKSLQADANKTQEQIYKENLAALKAQGLDTSEARDQYMKAQQAQRAETEKSFQNREYLRKAQFFAKWGSTPGNTLVAGMSALKDTIPDVIQDSTEKRAALQLADKAIYELGEAVRLEKLGMWEKAAAQKLKAAETAATLQGQITQASASIEGHRISAKGTTDAAGIRAASDEVTTGMTSSATRYSADQRLLGDRVSAAASARATAEAAAGRLSMKQSEAINKAAKELSLLPSEIEAVHSKNPDYVAAVKAKATAERVLANNPDSAPMKAQLANAQRTISGFTKNDGDIIRTARERLQAMEKRYYGPDYVASPAAPAEADPLGLRKSK
jgi:hypothetical protein